MLIKENTSLSLGAVPEEVARPWMLKMKDYLQFMKVRLTLTVVISAAAGFMLASADVDMMRLVYLLLGGFLVTAASNGFNQVMEKDSDALMTRTSQRPLPQNRMQVKEGLWLAGTMGVAGTALLWIMISPLCGILGALALIMYTLAYTPMKKRSPFAVFIGAFPGAIPPLLGWVAATGRIDFGAWLLFGIQFIWQFPHFWAIAWVLDDDYKKAGFRLLPSLEGRGKKSSFQILVYTIGLIPITLLPYAFGMTGQISAVVVSLCGVMFFLQAFRLHMTGLHKAATQLMFGSFLYLPLVQIALILDKTGLP